MVLCLLISLWVWNVPHCILNPLHLTWSVCVYVWFPTAYIKGNKCRWCQKLGKSLSEWLWRNVWSFQAHKPQTWFQEPAAAAAAAVKIKNRLQWDRRCLPLLMHHKVRSKPQLRWRNISTGSRQPSPLEMHRYRNVDLILTVSGTSGGSGLSITHGCFISPHQDKCLNHSSTLFHRQ